MNPQLCFNFSDPRQAEIVCYIPMHIIWLAHIVCYMHGDGTSQILFKLLQLRRRCAAGCFGRTISAKKMHVISDV